MSPRWPALFGVVSQLAIVAWTAGEDGLIPRLAFWGCMAGAAAWAWCWAMIVRFERRERRAAEGRRLYGWSGRRLWVCDGMTTVRGSGFLMQVATPRATTPDPP